MTETQELPDRILVSRTCFVSDRNDVLVPQVRFPKGVHSSGSFPQWSVEKALKVGVASPYEGDSWDADGDGSNGGGSSDGGGSDDGDGGAGTGGAKGKGSTAGKAVGKSSQNKARKSGNNK